MNNLKNSIFWILVMLFLVLFFTLSGTTFIQTFYFVSFLSPVVIGTSIYFNRVLVPDFLIRERYRSFGLYLVYTIVFSLYFQMLIIYISLLIFLNYQSDGRNILTIDLLSLSLMMYLLVLINAFIHILQAFNHKKEQFSKLEQSVKDNEVKSILVKANRKQHKIELDELDYIESLGDYVTLHSRSGRIITKEKISAIVQRLPDNFIRIHRSFIINTKKVDSFTKEYVMIMDKELPMSRTYKKQVLATLNK